MVCRCYISICVVLQIEMMWLMGCVCIYRGESLFVELQRAGYRLELIGLINRAKHSTVQGVLHCQEKLGVNIENGKTVHYINSVE